MNEEMLRVSIRLSAAGPYITIEDQIKCVFCTYGASVLLYEQGLALIENHDSDCPWRQWYLTLVEETRWIRSEDSAVLALRCSICSHELYFASQGGRPEEITRAIEAHNQRAHQLYQLCLLVAKRLPGLFWAGSKKTPSMFSKNLEEALRAHIKSADADCCSIHELIKGDSSGLNHVLTIVRTWLRSCQDEKRQPTPARLLNQIELSNEQRLRFGIKLPSPPQKEE